MGLKQTFVKLKEKAKQKHLVLLISLIYSFAWAVCKIVFGVFTASYFFCVGGASTLLFGFIKQVYLKHRENEDEQERYGKSITIAIMLIISSALFTFYMARLFFINEIKQYGLILSITIATFSFAELGISIYNFSKAKKTNDILLQAFKGCSLASSCYALVFTQVALLSATNSANNLYNAITGVVLGGFAVLIGIYLLIVSVKKQNFKVKIQNENKS